MCEISHRFRRDRRPIWGMIFIILFSRETKASLPVDRRPSMETDVRIDCTPVTASISTPRRTMHAATSTQKREKPLTLPPKLRSTPVAVPSHRVPYVHPTTVARDVE